MFHGTMFHPGRLPFWALLRRVPRWGWIAIGIAVFVPVIILLIGAVLVAVVVGLAALIVVVGILKARSLWRRLTQRRLDDGRKNVRVVVRRVDQEFAP